MNLVKVSGQCFFANWREVILETVMFTKIAVKIAIMSF